MMKIMVVAVNTVCLNVPVVMKQKLNVLAPKTYIFAKISPKSGLIFVIFVISDELPIVFLLLSSYSPWSIQLPLFYLSFRPSVASGEIS
ncbi:MAG: hypothetical protein A2729_05775 [Candidatus Buchananbacteria bacterium RIFCSPHIGHO2_01_FULL_39_14]|uniref:Uncharacterized protein n=2 Tax=Candidatus Buchananiibacteriota TaxID=1817903 RepID=A0A1G1YU31_9BACT|nr:MAG: hypothetical protein A2729_05775 [Candidatus Buchananbacteria bacterium RIFCSPHIGHO2_01_FULL_39_14]OGY48474.1 MAG: hypothetical protein A3D39_02585 [Candidatus Buchananbacteria bacterium RIFCSPHIGHO2_02_FULL_39_17]OGY55286.1 MAG: hypothetical protein A2912_02500 [Candidatus Buchananbacteria bacterium RIFCSPLOWO2_01_FULL_40_23b]